MQSYRKLCSPSYLAALRRFTSESKMHEQGNRPNLVDTFILDRNRRKGLYPAVVSRSKVPPN